MKIQKHKWHIGIHRIGFYPVSGFFVTFSEIFPTNRCTEKDVFLRKVNKGEV